MTKLLWLTPLLLVPFLGKKKEAAITVTNGTPTPPIPGAENTGPVAPIMQPTMPVIPLTLTPTVTANVYSNPGGANPGTYSIGNKLKVYKTKPNSNEWEIYDSYRSLEQIDPAPYLKDGVAVYVHDNGNARGELKYDLYLYRRAKNSHYYVSGEEKKYAPLREVKVFFSDGDVIHTNMAAHITDEQILDYYKPGRVFNLGRGEHDYMATVESVQIIK